MHFRSLFVGENQLAKYRIRRQVKYLKSVAMALANHDTDFFFHGILMLWFLERWACLLVLSIIYFLVSMYSQWNNIGTISICEDRLAINRMRRPQELKTPILAALSLISFHFRTCHLALSCSRLTPI